MNKCENCYHKDVCSGRHDVESYNIKCEEYKDKSLIVELPCNVGDTVYSFCEYWGVVLPYFVETLNISYYNQNENCYSYEANCSNAEQTDLLDSIDFDFDDIGKTVFLSREEAEKKLKERE